MLITEYAKTFLGNNYLWGGDSPLKGFDCSGLVLECLKSIGFVSAKTDMTAQGLYQFFIVNGLSAGVKEGAICFYGKSAREIVHVALMLNTQQIIEAGGGDSSTTSLDAAKQQGAFVRVRPYNYRNDLVAIIQPNYPRWVLDGTYNSI